MEKKRAELLKHELNCDLAFDRCWFNKEMTFTTPDDFQALLKSMHGFVELSEQPVRNYMQVDLTSRLDYEGPTSKGNYESAEICD